MAYTKIDGRRQIKDGSVNVAKLATESNVTWVMSSDNTAQITGLKDPTNANDVATKNYVDSLITNGVLKSPEAYATTSDGKYPETYKGGSVPAGATYIISDTTNGTIVGTKTVRVGDMLIALVANPGQDDNNWAIIERNDDLATEDNPGLIEIATQAETDAGTDDQRAVTPLKLKTALTDWDVRKINAGDGLTEAVETNGSKTINVVAEDNSIQVNADSIQVKIGNTNGDSLEVSSTGLELKQIVTGARTFQAGSGNKIVLDTDTNNAQLTNNPDGTVDLAIATVRFVLDQITSATTEIYGEAPSFNDGDTQVTLANTPKANTERVYLNGLRLKRSSDNTNSDGDYYIDGNTITFGEALKSGDIVLVDYKY